MVDPADGRVLRPYRVDFDGPSATGHLLAWTSSTCLYLVRQRWDEGPDRLGHASGWGHAGVEFEGLSNGVAPSRGRRARRS